MRVIVFGASGTVGQHVVTQALEDGYQVSAFCRNTSNLPQAGHPKLQTIAGDVFDPESVSRAVQGHDVVCIALGSGKSRKSVVRSVGTKHIIEAMQQHGVQRLICQSTLGTGDSNNNLNFFWKRIMFGWFLKQVFLDHELQEQYVRNSGLNWTIVRPGAFTDGPKTGQYQHGFAPTHKQLTLKISRADVADFILRQLRSSEYLHQSPGLSY